MTNQHLPEDIDLTDDVVAKFSKRRRLREKQWFAFQIQPGVEKTASGKGHLMLVMQCAPMTDPEDGSSTTTPMVRNNLCLPFFNPLFTSEDGKAHEVPDTAGLCLGFVRAIIGPEIPKYPFRDKKLGNRWVFNGEQIADEEVDEKKKEVNSMVAEILRRWWKDPTDLEGHRFYGLTKHEGDFCSIDRVAYELPPDATLCPPDKFLAD